MTPSLPSAPLPTLRPTRWLTGLTLLIAALVAVPILSVATNLFSAGTAGTCRDSSFSTRANIGAGSTDARGAGHLRPRRSRLSFQLNVWMTVESH